MKVVSVRFESPLQMFNYKVTLFNKLHSKLSDKMCTPGANLLIFVERVSFCLRTIAFVHCMHVVNISY